MILLITSCVAPPMQPNLILSDPQIRCKETIKGLIFFIKSGTFDKIVLCDNSGFTFNNDERSSLLKVNPLLSHNTILSKVPLFIKKMSPFIVSLHLICGSDRIRLGCIGGATHEVISNIIIKNIVSSKKHHH